MARLLTLVTLVLACTLTNSADKNNNTSSLLFNGTLFCEECKQSPRDAVDLHTRDSSIRINEHLFNRISIIYGITSLAEEGEINSNCYNQLKTLKQSIGRKDVWALKVLDSSGSPQTGFVFGQNYWLGSIQECEAVRNPIPITLDSRFTRNMKPNLMGATAPFDMEYRVVYAQHESPWQIEVKVLSERVLHIGLCAPATCTNDEITNMTRKYLGSSFSEVSEFYEHNLDVLTTKDLKLGDSFAKRNSLKVLGVIVLTITVLSILAYSSEKRREIAKNNNGDCAHQNGTSELVTPAAGSSMENMLKCFSIADNFKLIMDTKSPPGAVSIINGIRAISSTWILFFHVIWYMFYATSNRAMIFVYSEMFQFQYISNGPILVDAFFSISGFLLTFNFLKNEKKMLEIRNNSFVQNLKSFGQQLLHRFIRLTPSYLVVILLCEIATAYLSETSSFWIHERFDESCSKFWWRNMLYIHNLFNMDELCMNWSWSLSCEMQFFVVGLAVLYMYAKSSRKAVRFFQISFVAMLIISTSVSLKYRFVPTYDVMYNLGTELYTAPWTRILPYLCGMASAIMLHRTKNADLPDSKIRLYWTMAGFGFLAVFHSTVKRSTNHVFGSMCIGVVRITMGVSIAWMMFASKKGYGGWFDRLMSLPIFVHLSKLSYCVYLIHPLIISILNGLKETETHLDKTTVFMGTICVMVLTYIASIIISLLFEVPFYKVSSELLKTKHSEVKKAQ